MNRRVPGIEQFPDLVKRFEYRLGHLTQDNCGGCKLRDLIATFNGLVRARLKRDNDFRKR